MMTLDEAAAGPPFDIVVIGGGINGAAVAREAALRGLRTALFEQEDFGFGTTWRSTRLIHGGLRYLEHGDVRLVFEALQERAWLLKTRRHLVEPLRFLIPKLPWTRRPAWQLRAGLALYDLLALYRELPGHKSLSDGRLRELLPGLSDEAKGGLSFFDARALSPERLALELALEARDHGALVLNHARVTEIENKNGLISSVEVESAGRRFRVPTRAIVNAAGPWVDAVAAVTGDAPAPLLGVTKGTHIVLETDEHPGRDAVFSTAKSDGRVFFAVPQGRLLLIGTTDTRFEADASSVRPGADEIAYLLDEARLLFPGRGFRLEQVRYSYAGLRPLRAVKGGPEAAITRRHEVIDHAKAGGPEGLVSCVGGKLSTFRPLAREVIDRLAPGSRALKGEVVASVSWREDLEVAGLPPATARRLRKYGPAIPRILAGGTAPLARDAIEGEIRHAAGAEAGVTLSDILMRRSGLAWGASRGLDCHQEAAVIAGEVLGWSGAERAAQVLAFERDVAFHLPTPDELGSTANEGAGVASPQ